MKYVTFVPRRLKKTHVLVTVDWDIGQDLLIFVPYTGPINFERCWVKFGPGEDEMCRLQEADKDWCLCKEDQDSLIEELREARRIICELP